MLQRVVSRSRLITENARPGKWQERLGIPTSSSLEYIQARGKETGPTATKDSENVKPPRVKAFEEIPGPRSLPYIGTLYKYLPFFGEYSMGKRYETDVNRLTKYGPIVKERLLPGVTFVHLFDPEDIATMYQHEGQYPMRLDVFGLGAYRDARDMSQGLANLNGEAWHRLRSLLQKKMMRKTSAVSYLPAQAPVAEEFTTRMRMLRDDKGEIPNFLNELYIWALESIGVVCFDSRLGTFTMDQSKDSEVQHLIQAVGGLFEGLYKTTYFASLYKRWPNAPAMRKLFDDLDFLWKFSNQCIDRALERVANEEEMLIPAEDSLLLALLANPKLKRDEALVMITDLFTGGIDSTAHTLAFNLYNLAINPSVQRRLQEEIDQYAPRGTTLTHEQLEQMKYLVAVTKETSRLSPTVSGTMRRMVKDVVLSGYHIPAGTDVMAATSVVSRLSQYYDDPDTFRPERWLRNADSDVTDADGIKKPSTVPHFSVLPFGHGPRMCIGRRFAEQEVWLGLIKIFREFTVEYHYEPIGCTNRIFNTPDRPLAFTFIDRR